MLKKEVLRFSIPVNVEISCEFGIFEYQCVL